MSMKKIVKTQIECDGILLDGNPCPRADILETIRFDIAARGAVLHGWTAGAGVWLCPYNEHRQPVAP